MLSGGPSPNAAMIFLVLKQHACVVACLARVPLASLLSCLLHYFAPVDDISLGHCFLSVPALTLFELTFQFCFSGSPLFVIRGSIIVFWMDNK